MAARSRIHGTVKLIDGTTPTPNEITIPIQDGDLRFQERKEARTVWNRGKLKEFVEGSEEPVSVSFSITFEEWKGKNGGTASPVDALKKRGNASSWVSRSSSGPYTVLLRFILADVEASGGQNETLDFDKFHCDEPAFEEGEDHNTITVTGKALVAAPASTRA